MAEIIRYSVTKWRLNTHFYVTFFGDFKKYLPEHRHSRKFNTQTEAQKYINQSRRTLSKQGVRLELMSKDLAR